MNIVLVVAVTTISSIEITSLDKFNDSDSFLYDYEFDDYDGDTDWLFEDDTILNRNDKCKILDDDVNNFGKVDNSPYYPFEDKSYHDDNFEMRSFKS